MNIVLLSGGSGKRLWPLSNDIRSKQFIKIFKKEDGTYESMVQRVYRQIKKVDTDATVTIATSKTQVSAIHNQLGEDVGISVEPCRRDTFPAIALAFIWQEGTKEQLEMRRREGGATGHSAVKRAISQVLFVLLLAFCLLSTAMTAVWCLL